MIRKTVKFRSATLVLSLALASSCGSGDSSRTEVGGTQASSTGSAQSGSETATGSSTDTTTTTDTGTSTNTATGSGSLLTGKDIVYATSCAQDPTSSLYLIRRFNTRSGGIPGLEAEYFGAAGCTVAVGKVTMLANAEDKATSVTLNISAASLTLSIVPPTANSSSLCGYTNWPVGSPSTKDILGKTCDVQGIKIAPKSTDTFTVPYTLVGSTLTFAAPAAGAPNYAQIAGTYTAK